MKWELRERTEDAIAGYLRRVQPQGMNVLVSWEDAKRIKYPAAIVFAGAMQPISELATTSDHRMIDVAVVVATKLTIVDMLKLRDHHSYYFSEIYKALTVSDLNAQLVASEIRDIAFSGALLNDVEPPVVESEGRMKRTTIGLTVYCEPVEGT